MSSDQPPAFDAPPAVAGGGDFTANSESDPTPGFTATTESSVPTPPHSSHADSLGLGIPPSLQQSSQPPVLAAYPHLAHYIFNLLASVTQSPPRANQNPHQHPLSVSSSGESDGSDEDDTQVLKPSTHDSASDPPFPTSEDDQPKDTPQRNVSGGAINASDREALVRRVIDLLDNEEEEAVKDLLKPHMGDLGKDEILMDQVCLDCMHRRKDDLEQLPYAPHLTPTRARSSPSVNSHPLRPYTPTRVPSFRARTPLGRPQSPSLPPSGAQTPTLPHGSSSLARSEAALSPRIPPAAPSSSGYSSAGSPVASAGMLNAKAATFNPSPRNVSAPLTSSATSFSPSDPWKDVVSEQPKSASPYMGGIAPPMARTSSNLAIAAPLFSDKSSPFHSPIGTPNRTTIKMPDPFSSPSFAAPRPASRGIVPDDDDDDEFSPFGSKLPRLHHHDQAGLNSGARPFEPFGPSSTADAYGSSSTLSSSIPLSDSSASYGSRSGESAVPEMSADDYNDMSAGMTPLDVLHSVFTSLPRPELEDALHRSGYDFEGAMAILVSHHTLPRSGSSTPQRVASPRPLIGIGSRGALPITHAGPTVGYFNQGGRSYSGHMSPGFPGTRSPGGGGATRMCRYYLQGECRRSDCRFSHDLERALCRFWLRGSCAKGPNCEFMHHFPSNFDPHALSSAMSRLELSSDGSVHSSPGLTPQDEFPDLMATRHGRVGPSRFDPSRNRFANAVKRVPPSQLNLPSVHVTGARYAQPIQPASYSPTMEPRTPIPVVPRSSNRIRLRPPTLLPTLKTGAGANEQYMTSRANAIRLGHARNACLARAADAFRRGDGAAAKRFSREGKALNERVVNEANEAAQALVKERRAEAQKAVRERDPSWSDDPSDRASRGKECGGGLGVVMGVASSRSVSSGVVLSAEERTEALLDLHTLHGNEGADILASFLGDLERENFRGLAYVLVGEEKHVGMQDPLRGASKVRLGASVKQYLADWGYPWSESAGVICVDACRV